MRPACHRKAYVNAGDLLLEGEQRGAFTAVAYVGKDGGAPTEGWLETAVVQAVSAAPNWAGKRSGGDASIVIERGKRTGHFTVDGTATW